MLCSELIRIQHEILEKTVVNYLKRSVGLLSLGLREIEIEARNDLEIFKGNNIHISKHALKKRVNYTSDYALRKW